MMRQENGKASLEVADGTFVAGLIGEFYTLSILLLPSATTMQLICVGYRNFKTCESATLPNWSIEVVTEMNSLKIHPPSPL